MKGGLIAGTGKMAYGRTMAFTTLIFFQMFNVFNARSDTHSAFYQLFHNVWLFGAVALSIVLQIAVIYVPFLQKHPRHVSAARERLADLRAGRQQCTVAA